MRRLALALIVLGSLLAIFYLSYRIRGAFNLEYWVDRNGITLVWGPTRQIVPMGQIQRVVPSPQVAPLDAASPWHWPCSHRRRMRTEVFGTVNAYGTVPLGEQIILLTGGENYSISPQDPQAFLSALQERFALGANRTLDPELRGWRRHLHAHPETAFEERATAAFVAERLAQMGLEVHTGLAGTGVVGVLRHGTSRAAIGLRADLDALHIHEQSGVPHSSRNEGRMHACGHDGHTTMLLGAAKALARRKRIDGTVYFVFQPAEENEGGGRVMVEEGMFDRFPMDAVYGMHNWPSAPVGTMAMRAGPLMGAFDIFEIVATGKGAHAAMPYQGKDPMLFASHAIGAQERVVDARIERLLSEVDPAGTGPARERIDRYLEACARSVERVRLLAELEGAGPHHLAEVLTGIGHASDRTFTRRYCAVWPILYAAAAQASWQEPDGLEVDAAPALPPDVRPKIDWLSKPG